ncbi:pyridoxamine 5'-phosphate oxidase family protein [Streptomyces sp. NPDC001657]|uniref:pyridoxamine 5'-phosphate oxidase family protein n=1 Tax=Streptomyces sp. NPDC001657 TaxID=3154522 RepID=UPI0033323743
MRAHIGDQLVVESPSTGAVRRDGEIVGVAHEDGTPPYEVRWADTNEVTLVFPGPDAHVQHFSHQSEAERPQPTLPESGKPALWPFDPGDVGRRVAHERRRQRLIRAEVAERSGVSASYLAYLEERPANPTSGTLNGLAGALGTTVRRLRGGGVDLPPGGGEAGYHPELRELDPEECWDRLATHGVGRVAVTTADGLAVVPVNYEVVDGAIAFRTAPGTAPAAAVGTKVAFEVDHVDEAMSQGWSVLVLGPARAVTEPDAVRRLTEQAHTKPWAGGERPLWVLIEPERLTGRRIDTD